MDNPIGIDVKGNFDLRNAPGSRGNTHQFKLAEGLVTPSAISFHLGAHGSSPQADYRMRWKDLALFCRNRGVPFNQFGK